MSLGHQSSPHYTAGHIGAFRRATKPGRPLGLPGSFVRPKDPQSARYLLRRPAFDSHVRHHAAVNVSFRHREPLPVHGDILHPWLEGVLVDAIDDRNISDVLLDDPLSLLVDLQ